MMVQAGLMRRLLYRKQMGNTGTPGTNAPVLKRRMQRPSPQVPSGAITSIGKRLSFALCQDTVALTVCFNSGTQSNPPKWVVSLHAICKPFAA